MSKILKELIEYNGIDSYQGEQIVNFKQFNIEDISSIPIERPDIKQISRVWVDYEILTSKIIKTPKGISEEGQILTGNAVFVSAKLHMKIEYIGGNNITNMHSINQIIPINVYVVIDEKINDYSVVCPHLFIEDIHCELIDCRKIYINTTLITIADIC